MGRLVGRRVALEGIDSKLNGQKGVAIGFDDAKDLYKVKLYSGDVVAVKPNNLTEPEPTKVWTARVVSVDLVDKDGNEYVPEGWSTRSSRAVAPQRRPSNELLAYSGKWRKSLRLRVQLSEPIDDYEREYGTGLLAIARHVKFGGLWKLVPSETEGATVYCRVERWPVGKDEDGTWKPRPYAVEPPPGLARRANMIVLENGDIGRNPIAFIAPPLRFHARMTVFSIDSIDTVAQTFRANVYSEMRLRAIADDPEPELVNHLLSAYGLNQDMMQMMDVVEEVRPPERWSGFEVATTDTRLHDYTMKMRCHYVIAQEYHLRQFPFDEQDMSVVLSLNTPKKLASIAPGGNREFHSLFQHKSFQQKAVWKVLHDEKLKVKVTESKPNESAAGNIYPRVMFTLRLRRNAGYYITNVALPISVLTALNALSIGIREIDGSRIGTGERLALTFTLILTAVAYKFVVADVLPNVSYQTFLDVYVLICFFFMVLAAVENAVWNTIGYDRSGDEPVEVMDEFYVMFGYLGLFAIVNIGFWLFAAVAVSRTRAKSRKEWKHYLRGAPTLKSAVSAIVAERRLARRSLNAANNADFE